MCTFASASQEVRDRAQAVYHPRAFFSVLFFFYHISSLFYFVVLKLSFIFAVRIVLTSMLDCISSRDIEAIFCLVL